MWRGGRSVSQRSSSIGADCHYSCAMLIISRFVPQILWGRASAPVWLEASHCLFVRNIEHRVSKTASYLMSAACSCSDHTSLGLPGWGQTNVNGSNWSSKD